MIIAKIENQRFKHHDMGDAEALLQILSRAVPIEQSYDSEYNYYHYPDVSCSIAIEIAQLEIVTTDEHELRVKTRKEREAAAAKVKEAA
jgi:hypothetical protein